MGFYWCLLRAAERGLEYLAREANSIVNSVFVGCLRAWQIVPHNAININFSAIGQRENETALYSMHGVMNRRKLRPENGASELETCIQHHGPESVQ